MKALASPRPSSVEHWFLADMLDHTRYGCLHGQTALQVMKLQVKKTTDGIRHVLHVLPCNHATYGVKSYAMLAISSEHCQALLQHEAYHKHCAVT